MLHTEVGRILDRVERLTSLRYAVDSSERSINLYAALDVVWREISLRDGSPGGIMRRLTNGDESSVTVQWRALTAGANKSSSIRFLDCDCVVVVKAGIMLYTTSKQSFAARKGSVVKIPCGTNWHAQWTADAETVTTYFRAARCRESEIIVI